MLHIQVLTYKCYHKHHIYSFLKRFIQGLGLERMYLFVLDFKHELQQRNMFISNLM